MHSLALAWKNSDLLEFYSASSAILRKVSTQLMHVMWKVAAIFDDEVSSILWWYQNNNNNNLWGCVENLPTTSWACGISTHRKPHCCHFLRSKLRFFFFSLTSFNRFPLGFSFYIPGRVWHDQVLALRGLVSFQLASLIAAAAVFIGALSGNMSESVAAIAPGFCFISRHLASHPADLHAGSSSQLCCRGSIQLHKG